MKKFICFFAFAVLISGPWAFAEDQDMMENSGGGQSQGMMMGSPEWQMGYRTRMNPMMNSMMMGNMRKDSVVATSDGGVVVLSGPRLLKYDASLTLIKEVELPKGNPPASQQEQQNQGQPQFSRAQ